MKQVAAKQAYLTRTLAVMLCAVLLAACSEPDEETRIVNNQMVVPVLKDVEPSDKTEDVPLNRSVVLVFSEEMDDTSLTTNDSDNTCQGSVQVSDDDFNTCIPISKTTAEEESASEDGNYSYALKPNTLLSATTTYKVKVTTDLKSANNVAMLSDYTTPNGFTTGVHVTVPVVSTTSPLDEATQVSVDETVTVTFSEDMDAESFTAQSFSVMDDNSQAVSGSFAVNGKSVVFTPENRFANETTYTATLSRDILSASGQQLNTEVSFSFTTGPINVVVDFQQENTAENGSPKTFTVYLNSEPAADVTVALGSSDASEGTAAPSSLTFTAADWSTPQTVTITSVDDEDYDGSVAYSVNFQPTVSDDPQYNGFEPVDIMLYNHDDDIIGLQKDKLITDDGMDDDRFGSSVSLGREFAVVGAPYSDDNGLASGSAYVYKRNPADGTWSQARKLVAEDAGANDYFGFSVALSGENMAVGSRYDDESGTNAGAVYFYRRNGDNWEFVSKATAAGSLANDYLGFSLAMEGDYAVVGATGRDDNGAASGTAYIFKRNTVSGSWFQVDKLLAADGADNDQFGYAVGISGDFVIVGAPFDDDTAADSGSLYVFKKDAGADTWSQVSKVVASSPDVDDRLGYSVSISGNHAVGGMPLDDDVASATGSAIILKQDSGLDTWSWFAKLTASDAMANDQFGGAVAIYNGYIAVGARYEDNANGANAGAVYLYRRDDGDGSWDPLSKIVAADGQASDYLGSSVSIFGGNILSGAYLNNNENGFYAGAAFIFR